MTINGACLDLNIVFHYYLIVTCLQEVAQSVRITPKEADVTNSNPPSPSCADMLKKKKKATVSKKKNKNKNKKPSKAYTISISLALRMLQF
jgi:hypothetical protein